MSLLSKLKAPGANGYGYSSTAEEVTQGLSLEGKCILITGCNSGLGLETMRVLALRGAHVIGTARTEARAAEACRSVGGTTTALACELADPKSVNACVQSITNQDLTLDAIIANAGIMALPECETAFGYELQFFTNHVGHFMLVTGLVDSLADDGRVVVLSSSAHKGAPKGGIEFDNLDGSKAYTAWGAYGQSKLANLLFAKELARRWAATGKTANACHPGIIGTNVARHRSFFERDLLGPFAKLLLAKSVGQGAATQCYLAVNPGVAGVSGKYFVDCNEAQCSSLGEDVELARRLWDRTEEIVANLPT